jgi:hypothetical protein
MVPGLPSVIVSFKKSLPETSSERTHALDRRILAHKVPSVEFFFVFQQAELCTRRPMESREEFWRNQKRPLERAPLWYKTFDRERW